MTKSNNLKIVEDFLPDAAAYRAEVLRHPFHDVWFGGGMFTNIQVHSTYEHRALLEAIVERPIEQAYSFLRANYRGEFPHNPIHNDDDIGGIAAILYLNTPHQCRGGTALWRHKPSGLERMPSPLEIKHGALRTGERFSYPGYGKSPKRFMDAIYADGKDPDKWELVQLADMKTNRLILYPAACFHSRFDPTAEEPFEGFGTDEFNVRLIWISFFKWKA